MTMNADSVARSDDHRGASTRAKYAHDKYIHEIKKHTITCTRKEEEKNAQT